MKKTISMLLALVMVLGLLPAAVFATGTNNVYISVSFGRINNEKLVCFVQTSFPVCQNSILQGRPSPLQPFRKKTVTVKSYP